ncbi:MAG: hypothetical protein H7227_04540 [Actinobacteria bacterium]|nr:hypothetical protein [Actinomycetota bacterium]
MKRFQSAFIFVTSIALILCVPSASAATKIGMACKKVGQSAKDSGKKYQCVKSGKKLIWLEKISTGDSNPQNKLDPKVQSFAWPSPDAKYITAVPVDLDQINSISKYASCSGHNRDGYTFDKILVTNLSLKHYWYPITTFQGTLDKVKVFAPFNGTVSTIQLEADKGGLGRPKNGNGLGLSTSEDKNVIFSFGHIYFSKKLKIGDSVKAGELLGYAALSDPNFDFDIDLEGKTHAPNGAEILGSIFDHMTKKVLDTFVAHSITPEEMKIPLAQRQSNPCDYNAGKGRTTSDWVALKGEKFATTEISTQNKLSNSNSGVKPAETQRPIASTESGNPNFQQLGTLCDPTKGASGKTSDGKDLLCNAASDGKSYWQIK